MPIYWPVRLRPSMTSFGLALHLDFLLARRGVFYIQTLLDNFCFRLREHKCYLSKGNWAASLLVLLTPGGQPCLDSPGATGTGCAAISCPIVPVAISPIKALVTAHVAWGPTHWTLRACCWGPSWPGSGRSAPGGWWVRETPGFASELWCLRQR